MSQQTVATSITPEVIIEKVLGELQVKGWERPEVSVKAHPDELTLEEQDDVVTLSCRGNCTIRLPHDATLRVERVYGDARFKLLEDQLIIEQIMGSLTLRSVAGTQIESVQGNLSARQVAGDLLVNQVMGNAEARNVQGRCLLEEVSGNLELRDVDGEVNSSARGNADLRLRTLSGENYSVECSGNLRCRLPEDASTRLELSSEAEDIRVRQPTGTQTHRKARCELNLGAGEVAMKLSAGGSLYVSSQPADWAEPEDLGADFSEGFGFSGDYNSRIADQIAAQIESQMEAMTRRLNEQMANLSSAMGKAGLSEAETEALMERARETQERAAALAQEKMRRAQAKLERKLEAARRRSEMKAQAAERRSQSRGRRPWSFEWPSPPPPPPKEPVSDEERLMILRMLEQKKITLQEAEELLAALEGKDS